MRQGDSYHFSSGHFLSILCLFVTAVECSSYASSAALANTIVFDPIMDETTILFAVIVTPTPDDNLARQMQNNAVMMTFSGANINQFENIRDDFLRVIANMLTSQCVTTVVDCGTQNQVIYTRDHVTILPGYPRQEGSDVVVAFSVVLPDGADDDQVLVLEQHVLLSLATGALDAMRKETGLSVTGVEAYSLPSASSGGDDDGANLSLILPLTLIPAAIIIGLGAIIGSLYTWKIMKKHRSLNFNDAATPEVEMIAYQNTDNK